MRYAQTDSFPQNPAGPSPPGAHISMRLRSTHGLGRREICRPFYARIIN